MVLMANGGNELGIRNFVSSTPWAKKKINFHSFQIAVCFTLFVSGFLIQEEKLNRCNGCVSNYPNQRQH